MYLNCLQSATTQITQSHDTPQSLEEDRGLDKASDQGELGDSRRKVVERISFSNKVLRAERIEGGDRYSVELAFKFPLAFSKSEAKRLIEASDNWSFPQPLELQKLIELVCEQGGAS